MKDLYQNFIINKKNIFQIKEKINDNLQLILNLIPVLISKAPLPLIFE